MEAMPMGLLSLLMRDPVTFFVLAVLLLYSVIAHEIAHGLVALRFGDDTAKNSGRLSLNPLLHIDPIGALALFIVGFGWAKPVPINYGKLGNSRLALVAVSLSGCIANIIIATVAISVLHLQAVSSNPILGRVLEIVARINIILGAFNLIPIPPLDGSKVLMGFLPYKMQQSLAKLERYGFFILIALLFTGLLEPVIAAIQNVIIGLISLIVR
jgi:Zn-dependent protease